MMRPASAVVIAMVLNATTLVAQTAVAPNAELVVKVPAAEVHKYPTVASAVLGKTAAGTVLEVRRNLGSWVEVPWPGSETGIAFVHVNTGTIAPRSAATTTGTAQDAAAQISAVAAAATAAGNQAGTRNDMPSGASRASLAETYVALPSHRIGIGALTNRVDASNPAFGATARTWWGSGLGVQFNLSRPEFEHADGRSMRTTQYAPSILYSLPDGVATSVWLRPYIGGGPRFYHANLETRLGYEALGGAEATFAGLPQFALSADLGYRWSRPAIDDFTPRQFAFSLSGHWYVK